MKRFVFSLIVAVVVGCNCQPADCQTALNQELDIARAAVSDNALDRAEELAFETQAGGFHRALVLAGHAAVKDGTLTRLELLKLRAAMLSPAMRKRAEDLVITQMLASGESPEFIPYDDDGRVDRGSINWEGLANFLKEMAPLILMLIKLFSGMGAVGFFRRRFSSMSIC